VQTNRPGPFGLLEVQRRLMQGWLGLESVIGIAFRYRRNQSKLCKEPRADRVIVDRVYFYEVVEVAAES